MISLIIQEHNEGREFVQMMVNQASRLPMGKELIYVTSMQRRDFERSYGPFRIPVTVIGNIQSCGEARNQGARMAVGETLLFMDSHVCFPVNMAARLLTTLEAHQDAIVAPAIQPVEFPQCTPAGTGGLGHGVAFRFADKPFEWVWIPAERTDREFAVPFVCGCSFAMKKKVFGVLDSYGGFLGQHTGLSWEEEKSMRLWRLGYPTYMEPRAIFGHYFKAHPNHKTWDEHSTAGFYQSRVAGFYINVFDKGLWDRIESMLIKQWGSEYSRNLEWAKQQYGWLRNLMRPYANRIDERWFLRTQ